GGGRLGSGMACPDGDPGCRGPSGDSGSFPQGPFPTVSIVSELEFLETVLATLNPLSAEWAEHKARVDEYFFCKYNGALSDRRHFARLAADEFRAAILLQPNNARALELQSLLVGSPAFLPKLAEKTLIGGNANPLNLARDLNLIPRFEAYIDAFTHFGALTFDFLTLGT